MHCISRCQVKDPVRYSKNYYSKWYFSKCSKNIAYSTRSYKVTLALFPSHGFDLCRFLSNMGRGVGAGLGLAARMLCYFRASSLRVIYFLLFFFFPLAGSLLRQVTIL